MKFSIFNILLLLISLPALPAAALFTDFCNVLGQIPLLASALRVLSQYPSCAVGPILMTSSPCGIYDLKCRCSNNDYLDALTKSMLPGGDSGCSKADAIKTRQAWETVCAQYVDPEFLKSKGDEMRAKASASDA